MKKWWREYFYWNRTERRGTLFLLGLMLALMGVNWFVRWRSPSAEPMSDPEFLALATQFGQEDSAETGEREYPPRRYAHDDRRSFEPHKKSHSFHTPTAPFDPNGLPQAEWERLGLSEAQAASVKRFEEKGGRFYRKEDLKKLYVISEEFYAHIEPFLLFPEKTKTGFVENKTYTRTETAKVDINRADSTQLALLPGVSPKMAVRILKIRETFGGFHSMEQVQSLNGFYAPQYEKLLTQAYAGPVNIRPLNLNYCTFKELMAVPGVNYETAKAIMQHRERNGFFKKTEDLLTLNLAEPGLYAKIAPYLAVK